MGNIGGTISGGGDGWASGLYSTIGGGRWNRARGAYSVVAGGGGSTGVDSNLALGNFSTIGGGSRNIASGGASTIGGGRSDTASGAYSTIGGGFHNAASGDRSTVPGGYANKARGTFSIAAGVSAKANHSGAVVIVANSNSNQSDSVRSGGAEQMVLRADAGLFITNNSGLAPYDPTKLITTIGGAYLSGNGTTWTNASDKNQKENFVDVDAGKLLERLSELPISRWNYKNEDESVTHIGPMAQDFYALFDVGTDDVSISTIDPAGIALAAIKALYKENKELKVKILDVQTESREEIRKLEKLLRELFDNK